jgi:hypothetical protein
MLVAQFVALFLRRATVRVIALIGTPALITAMLVYVSSRPVRADEGVNIGGGVLALWLVASLVIALVGLFGEGVRIAVRRRSNRHS